MQDSVGQDRRRFERIDRSLVTYYRKFEDATAESMDRAAVTRNISEGGILLELDDEFMIGDRLDIEISLRNSAPPLHLRGTIVRKISNMFGISFEDMSDPDRLAFRDYVRNRKEGRVE